MADKRMFSKKIIDTDWFMDMPASSQNLYFHLSMRADDDGFVASPKRIIKLVGATEDDFKLLVVKKFIIPFESGVCVITDWRINNYLRNDRYTETIYKEEKELLQIDDNGKYILNECQPVGIPKVDPVYIYSNSNSISISKSNNNIEKERINKKEKAPTIEEVYEYANSRGRGDLAKNFYDYYTATNWCSADGKKVKSWKGKFVTWEMKTPKGQTQTKQGAATFDYLKQLLQEEQMKNGNK